MHELETFSRQILTPCKSGNEPGIWSSTLASAKYSKLRDRPDMTEKLLTGRLSLNTTNQITRSKQPLQSQYTLHGQFLESIDSAKYLGVTISQDLNWNNRINNIIGKANRTLGFVKRNVKTRNEPVKELAYKTLVRPQVEYASSIWNPYTKQNINKIEMIQMGQKQLLPI